MTIISLGHSLQWGKKMAESQKNACPRLWISYLQSCGEARHFSYLVAQLREMNIEATYDAIQLRPDMHLGQRIAQRLRSIGFDGWMYILTHQFLTRGSCANELVAAIEETRQQVGPGFPMLGLLHGIAAQHVPLALRVRPCLSLGDPDWKLRVLQALKQRALEGKNGAGRDETHFNWKIHSCYGGDPSLMAIEVAPKLESIPYWRFAIPKPAQAARWGAGAAGGGEISPIKFGVARGTGRYGSCDVTWFGAANSISNTESAYVVFCRPLPDFVCFGPADGLLGPPGPMEIFRTSYS
jgi:hypothetical protein